MKLDTKHMRYLAAEDWKVLAAVSTYILAIMVANGLDLYRIIG